MHSPSEKIFASLAEINESISEINSPVSFGDTEGEARLDTAHKQLSDAISSLIETKTVPGTHACRAKIAACRSYFRQVNCDDDGELLDDVGLVGELVWSVLSDFFSS